MTDTSREAVEMLARFHATSATLYDSDDPEESGGYARGVATAATLRALVDERDALMEALKAYDDAMTSCWGAPEYLPDGNPDAARCWPMARAAIAKTKGGDQ
jgi:hypothetical protein